MNKLKKLWKENSILIVLFMILIICLVAIMVVVVTYFVGDSKTKYGDRLEGLDKIVWTDKEEKEINNKLKEDESIKNVSIETYGKNIYVKISFDSKITLVEAQSKALSSLDLFSEDVLGYFDIEFLIEADKTDSSDGFKIIGSHNVSGTGGIMWNNNTKIKDSEE